MKTYLLKIDNSNVMSSIEKADLKITSPSGKTIFLKKRNLSIANKDQREVFWKFCNDPMIRFQGNMEATREEMQILLDFSKLK